MADDSLTPITHERLVACDAAHACATYVDRVGEWWDPRYTANPDTLRSVTIEPRVGGRIFATHDDMGDHEWGEVTVWEPGRRLVHTFTLAQEPGHPSEVAVEFVNVAGGCEVRFSHGGWTEANAKHRSKFSDWSVMLDRFAALAEG